MTEFKKDKYSDDLDKFFSLFAKLLLVNLFEEEIISKEDSETTDDLLKEYHKRERGFFSFFDDFLWGERKNLLWKENGSFNTPPSIFNQKFFEILRKYLNFSHLEYFSIPIIGTISSGKSTFLNNFLGFNYLESSAKKTTQFICIIRHNPNSENPELYSVELKPRDSVYHNASYNFKKKEKIASGENEIKKKIIEINNEILNDKELSKKEKSVCFYILETKLSIFEGENEKYCNMFEFMDIPGLNEMSNFFPNEIIPLITPNTQFSIFFFDATNIQSTSTDKVFNKYVKLLNAKINKNSLFVINKFDEVKLNLDKEEDVEKTKTFQIYDYIFRNFHTNLDKNKIITLDSRNLKYEKNRLKNFDDFILFFANNLPINKDEDDFVKLVKKEIKTVFNIKKISKPKTISDEVKNYNKETYNNLCTKLEQKNFKIDSEEYMNLFQIFLDVKKKINEKKEEDKKEEKIEKLIHQELYESFGKSFKDLINEFVGNETFITLLRIYNILLIRLYEYSEDEELKEKALKQIFHLRFHIDPILKKEENKLNQFYSKNELTLFRFSSFQYEIQEIFNINQQKYYSIFNSLKSLKQSDFVKDNFMTKLIKDVENIEPFIKNKNIKMLFFSSKKSGKSSLINTLIGNNILPIKKESNINIIIKHSLNETELYKCECITDIENNISYQEFPFKNPIENYFYFKISENVLAKGNEVKKKINELNNQNLELKNSFYVLKTPIKFFDMIKINENVANKIEIIDLSSKFFNLDFNKNDKIINSLISFSDVFTYVDSYENFSNKNLNEINNVIFYLSVYNKSFNLNNFLYVINKSDLKSENEENVIDDLINIIKSEKIQCSSFSCKNIILDEKTFIENLILEAKEENIEHNLLENILNKFEKYNIYKKSIKSLLNSQKKKNEENKELEEYIKNLLKNDIKENELENSVKLIIKYYIFVKEFINENPVENSNELYEKLYSNLFKSKFFLDYEFLMTIENICNYLYVSFESIFDKIKKKDIINENNLNDVDDKFSKLFQNEIITKAYNKFVNFKNELFPKLINENNLESIIKEEKLIIEEVMKVLNNFDKIFNDLKKDLNFNDINIQTNIRLNSYEHGKIKFDNVETQTYLGWLSMYFVKSDNKEIFSIPIYFDSFNKRNNLEDLKEIYKIKIELYDIYIKKIINFIYFESKENLIQIFNFKTAKFEEIKNNKYEFMKYYIHLYQNFENILNQIELENRKK